MRSNFFSLWPKPLWAACLCLAFFGAGPWRQTEAQAQTNSQPAAQLRQAPEPPTEPILRVETGMHTAKINRIAVDAAGRYLVTGSNDKTARVWELATGRLLRVLRPPIGSGFEGMINAVAITPDGRYVAVAGETGAQWSDREIDRENRYSIYVFNRESGAMWNSFRQISLGRLSNAVLSMAFSPDGKKLVATIAGKGVRIIDRIHTDYGAGRDDPEKYNGYEINGIDFDRAGRMATTCTDGYLRLYDKDVDFVRKVRAPGGERPYAVRFSPDGSKLAVGYDDSTRVDVLDGDSLEELYKASASGVRNGDLRAVAWSADGSALYAGGGWHNEKGEYLIRRWAEAGRGRHQDLVAAGDTIMDLAPSEDGGVIFGTREPSWGVFSAKGARVRFVGRETADYRDNQGGFVANETGGVVGFSYESSGKSPARFSVADRQLNPGLGDGASLRPPRVDGLPISDWKDSQTPALKGQTKLKLFAGEYSRSLAVAPDAQRFLLAGDRSMRLFDQNGNELWVNEIPASAGSVNISGDGKLAIAALADGAIRWYRMSDGKELLAFFPHKDRKRWALWTPSGYYDCSPGAENLIGWHVNRDKYKAADFYPAGRFRNTYYRPDVISRILETGDEAEALKLANEKSISRKQESDPKERLSPVITVVSPADNSEIKSTTVTVRYSLRLQSSDPVTGIKVFIDGRPAGVERGVGARPQDGQTGELTVTVPSRDCEIALVAENQYASSVASVVRLRWRGAPEAVSIKPKLYVLAVGVSKYSNTSLNLNYPAKDARDFVETMRSQEGGLYRQVEIRLLADQQATKDNILDGLEWIQRQTTSRDVAMVFFAGHGVTDNLNRYFFCSHNFDDKSLMRTGVGYSDIKSAVEAIAGKALFFIDTCHAGNEVGSRSRGVAADIIGLVNELSSVENGVIVFTAATGRQNSLEDAKWANGAFTKALVEGLKGAADIRRQGKITVSMLDFYVSERVKELTSGKQTPATVKPETVPDFPIAIKR